jgi:flagellar biosynthetic protein FlhB
MAEEEQQRSEKASPWKLEQARKKGSVPKGMDFNSFLTLAVLTGTLYISGPGIFSGMLRLFAAGLGQAGLVLAPRGANALATGMLVAELRLWAGLMALLMLAGAIACLAQTGPVLSFTPIKPDFKRLNPVEGLKRFFNMKLLFDALRAVVKAALLAVVIWYFLKQSVVPLFGLMHSDVRAYPPAVLKLALQPLCWCLLALIPIVVFDIVVFDIVVSRRQFQKRMMMSRREVQDEHKQREGDPRIRSRQRALQKEVRQRSASLRRVKDADVLITNPTRLAVALKYDDAGMPAPIVLAKGAGKLAALMREMAWRHRVPVVQNRRLALALFRSSGIDQPIAADSYLDVARVLIWLRAMASRSTGARA